MTLGKSGHRHWLCVQPLKCQVYVWAGCSWVCPLQTPPGKSPSLRRACPWCQGSRALSSRGASGHSLSRSRNSSCQYLNTMLTWPRPPPLVPWSKGDWHHLGEPRMGVPNGFMSGWLFLQTQEWVWLLRSTWGSPWSGCVTAKVTRTGDSCQLQTAQICMVLSDLRTEQQASRLVSGGDAEFRFFVVLFGALWCLTTEVTEIPPGSLPLFLVGPWWV